MQIQTQRYGEESIASIEFTNTKVNKDYKLALGMSLVLGRVPDVLAFSFSDFKALADFLTQKPVCSVFSCQVADV